MCIYFLFDLVFLFMSFVYNKRNKKIIFCISCILLFILLGLHNGTGDPKGYGYDFPHYLNFFRGHMDMYGSVDHPESYELEMPYYYMCKFLRLFGNYDFIYIIGCALIYNIPFLYLVNHYSNNKPLSILLLFIVLNTTLHLFVVAAHRQMLGNTFFLLATILLLSKKNINWKNDKLKIVLSVLSLLIALLSHSSSYFILPILLFVFYIKVNNKNIILVILIISFILGIIASNIMLNYMKDIMLILGSFENIERTTIYLNNDIYDSATSSFNALLPLTLLTLVFVYFSNKAEINSFFLKCLVMATIIINLFFSVPLISRSMTTLLLIGIAGSIPYAITRNKNARMCIFTVAMMMMYLAYKAYSSPSFRMLPFKFIWE